MSDPMQIPRPSFWGCGMTTGAGGGLFPGAGQPHHNNFHAAPSEARAGCCDWIARARVQGVQEIPEVRKSRTGRLAGWMSGMSAATVTWTVSVRCATWCPLDLQGLRVWKVNLGQRPGLPTQGPSPSPATIAAGTVSLLARVQSRHGKPAAP